MNAEEGAAVLYPGAESGALLLGECVPTGVAPDDKLELAELLGVHDCAILGLKERPAAALRHRGQRRVRGLNRGRVAEAIDFREDQDPTRFESGRKSRRDLIEYRLREVFAHESS